MSGPPWLPEGGFDCHNCDNSVTHPSQVTVRSGAAIDFECDECGSRTLFRKARNKVEV